MLDYSEELERRSENSVTDWDYIQCRCANNGDYCEYCSQWHDPESAAFRSREAQAENREDQ